jgi:hypothetical protein
VSVRRGPQSAKAKPKHRLGGSPFRAACRPGTLKLCTRTTGPLRAAEGPATGREHAREEAQAADEEGPRRTESCNPRHKSDTRGAARKGQRECPKSRLDAARCLALYRIRWQVELLFKRWKSLCGFDRLPNYLDETILAWLHAKVLLALLMQRMASFAFSPPKQNETRAVGQPRPSHAPTLETRFAALARYHRRAAAARAA